LGDKEIGEGWFSGNMVETWAQEKIQTDAENTVKIIIFTNVDTVENSYRFNIIQDGAMS